jgi:riboflavin synthase
VNLELPLRADERLGGHVVQGHVDGLGAVRDVHEEGFARVVTIDADRGCCATWSRRARSPSTGSP